MGIGKRMTRIPDKGSIDGVSPKRVVVLIDASPDALRALEAAAELAGRYGIPLLAVSVEEPDRVRSEAYAFAREIGALSGSIRPIDEALLSWRREHGPASIRRAVERASQAAEVTWELVVLRGRLIEEVLALSRPDDFLMLGRVGWSARLGRKLGGASLALARRADGLVHICSARPMRERGRIAVLVEDFAVAGPLLKLAVDRARIAGRELVVLVTPSAAGDRGHLAESLDPAAPRWRARTLPALTTGEMLRALAEEVVVELVVARRGGWLESRSAARLLAHWQMPVLVVGGG